VTLVAVFLLAAGPSRRLAPGNGRGAAQRRRRPRDRKVVSELVDRARPFVADPHGVHLFSAHAADPGSPATTPPPLRDRHRDRPAQRGWGLLALAAATVLSLGRVASACTSPPTCSPGPALGAAAALALWSAPLRARVDALADFLGSRWDGLLGAGARRLASPGAPEPRPTETMPAVRDYLSKLPRHVRAGVLVFVMAFGLFAFTTQPLTGYEPETAGGGGGLVRDGLWTRKTPRCR